MGIIKRVNRGQGYKVNGVGQTAAPPEYFNLPVVTPQVFTPFRLAKRSLRRFEHRMLHRRRSRSIFRGPLLICLKAGSEAGAERGRFSAAISKTDVLYTENFTGISFAEADDHLAYVLSGILNSSLISFQLAFGGPTWGLERPTVLPHDLLSLRVPSLLSVGKELLESIVSAEKQAALDPNDLGNLVELDEAVFSLYDLEPDERILVRESVARARYLIFENRGERIGMVKPPSSDILKKYAKQVGRSVDAYLRARGERHLEAVVYTKRLAKGDLGAGVPGVTAVRFTMASGAPRGDAVVREGDPADLDVLAALLRGRLESKVPPYLNERRQLRLYGADDLFILKPTETRYWTATAGLNDADVILADHWLRRRDVLAHA